MTSTISRRSLMRLVGAGPLALVAGCAWQRDDSGAAPASPPVKLPPEVAAYDVDPALLAMTVFKDPTCACCGGWVTHARQHGISVDVEHPEALAKIFEEHRIPVELQSCHLTLNRAGTVFVGHVPVKHVLQYLADPPAGSRGLSVPAMPVGTPGMEQGNRFEPYQVLLLREEAPASVFAEVAGPGDQRL